jgi:23S rRNA pseudouridine1911/1915/1917 synthase
MNINEIIIFENDELVAINKPAGLLSIPDREGKDISLKTLLRKKYGGIFVVHRLDRDTSGIIVFAKTEETHRHLSIQFENRETEKNYNGLVLGSLPDKKGMIDAPIAEHPSKNGVMTIHKKGKESLTDYEMLEDYGIYSWLAFRIHTGRTHQIRVHMKHLGHPVVCDELYGDGKPVFISSLKRKYKLSRNEEQEKPILGRLALHSSKLKFTDKSNAPVELEAPLPKDLKATLNQLQKIKKGR